MAGYSRPMKIGEQCTLDELKAHGATVVPAGSPNKKELAGVAPQRIASGQSVGLGMEGAAQR